MFEVSVFDTEGNDVISTSGASQSSTLKSFSAGLAIDGNDSSFSHTDVGTQGNNLVSWSAPLLYSVLVGSVLIKNRYCQNPSDPNGCLCRLSSATISLADENGNIFAYQELGNTCGQLEIEVNEFIPYETNGNETSSNPTPSPGPCYPLASKIKLQSITGMPIAMFEIEVMSSGQNVALGKSATQSATFKNKPSMSASAAVDGDVSTFSHTEVDSCSWFEVDLEASLHIESFKIVNRWCKDESDPNGCLCRMSGAAVSIFDGDQFIYTTLLGDMCAMKEWVHTYGSSDWCS